MYEVTADEAFWTDVSGAKRGDVDVSDAELVVLHRTRAALQERWRTQVLMPPGPCGGTPGCAADREDARGAWWAEFATYAIAETRDPFRRIEAVQDHIRGLRGKARWCDECIANQICGWDAARNVWWKELDVLLENASTGAR